MPSISGFVAALSETALDCLSWALKLTRGHVVIVAPAGGASRLLGPKPGPCCRIEIRSWLGFLGALPFGSAGIGRAYAAGYFEADDLVALAQLKVEASDRLASLINPLRAALRHIAGWRLRLNKNTRRGSVRNVQAHYDIGNNFYALWLDPGMTYSAALFEGDNCDLEAAQAAKYQRVLDYIGAPEGGHLLEIGCGWGGFAELAGRVGFRVTAITLSEAQLAYTRRRIHNAGLADRVTVELLDYRDVVGSFDGIASIEMIEAVGEAYWPSFFNRMADVLKPGARAVLQVTTVPDDHFKRYMTGTDFIRKEIFPGGMLISPGRVAAEVRAAGLRLTSKFQFGQDYAKTLALWCATFDQQLGAVRALGFDEHFIRSWRLYLLGCQGLFETGDIDVGQYGLERPISGSL